MFWLQEVDEAESDENVDEVIRRVMDAEAIEFYSKFNINQDVLRKAVRLLQRNGVPLADITKTSQIEGALRDITEIPKKDVQGSFPSFGFDRAATTKSTC